MTAPRASALLLSLLLASPAAAQVRVVPSEAGSAPMTGRPAGAPAPIFSPSRSAALSASSLIGPLSFSAPSAAALASPSNAPLAAASLPQAAAAPSAFVQPAAPSPALAAAPELAKGRASFAAPSSVPSAGRASAETRLEEDAAAISADPGVLFDGRVAHPALSAAEDGPALAPRTPASAAARPLAPSRLRRALRAAAVAIPAVALAAAAGVFAPHVSLIALHWVGQAAYYLANPFAFFFTFPQIHKMITRRSADISAGMIGVGIAATAMATMNFAFDHKSLMTYRNLTQMLGFAVMLFLKWRYSRSPDGKKPSKLRATLVTGAITLGVVGALFAAGHMLMAVVPAIALMGSLLVPLQIVSGFGFTYLMYVQLSKMARARSTGDSSPAMMWSYLGTKTIWVWSLVTMLSLATAPAWLVLPAAAALAAVCWLAGGAALNRLVDSAWSFLPEKLNFLGRSISRERLSDAAAFVALSALILALSAGAYFALIGPLAIPAAAASRFAMYLLYMVQSLFASLATLKTLRLQKSLGQKAPSART
ncbi:MAG: hypothetical protein ACHQ49_11115 [Elusimicrobiota bacterium]